MAYTSHSLDDNDEVLGESLNERGPLRAASRAGGRKRRKREIADAMLDGLPSFESLRPVLTFLMMPAMLAVIVALTHGGLPKVVLYPFAAVMGLYLVFNSYRSSELVVAVLLFYLPFTTTYVIPIAPGVNGTNMLLLLGLCSTILQARYRREPIVRLLPGSMLVLAYGFLTILSGPTAVISLPSGMLHLIYGEILSYKAWIDQFIFYIIVLGAVRDHDTAKRMVIYMVIASAVLVLYALPEMFDRMGRGSIERMRVEGPQQQSNNFGGFVAYTMLPAVSLFIVYIKNVKAWIFTPYFLIAAKVLISTFSRGAYLAMAVGAFLAAYYRGKGFLFMWATIGFVFLLLFPRYIPESVLTRMDTILQSGNESTSAPEQLDKSSEHRLKLWSAGVEMTLESPVFGKGYKGFQRLKEQYVDDSVHERDPHNMYLFISSQMGLPALGAFVILLGFSFHSGRVLARDKEDKCIRAIGIGGASLTACYAVICLFGSRAVNLEFTSFFWAYFVCMQVLRCTPEQLALTSATTLKQRRAARAKLRAAKALAKSNKPDASRVKRRKGKFALSNDPIDVNRDDLTGPLKLELDSDSAARGRHYRARQAALELKKEQQRAAQETSSGRSRKSIRRKSAAATNTAANGSRRKRRFAADLAPKPTGQ